ncbi:hypothetical protein BDV95DRAFT_670156 [Massariosphaeria phaeospora]|uniref:Azaphilone pigments biosynthesis cluster protein L N-terminal domain-containing protein n=1 Tax=Massariosphaeria phaeospora TaxID=100035 RepID=A0A7C8I1R7_9PLEO|nr:hypothetical protein BDV95DRAFT_670156 [Massariosphaeria phaeospora]
MADPLSGVGSVVGIVSLGITLCTGLISYIDDVRSAKEKAGQIKAEVDQLTKVLELLETVVGKASASPITSVTKTGVVACSTAIDKITELLGKDIRSNAGGVRACLHNLKEKLCFPFSRKADILYWQNVLREVQQSLQITLPVLQIDEGRTHTEAIRQLIMQETQLIHEEYRLMKLQSQELLENVRLQNAQQTQFMNSAIESSTRSLQSSIQQQLTPISKSTQDTSETLAAMSSILARLDHHMLSSISPSSVAIDPANHQHLGRDIRRLRSRSSRKNQQMTNCGCNPRSETSVYFQWPFFLSRKRTTVHESYCPRAAWEAALTDIEFRFSLCIRALKARLALSYHNGSELQIKPALMIRRVVSESSPAFRLLRWERFQWRELDKCKSLVDGFPGELLRLFQERRATPHDRLEDGSTLLHYFLKNITLYGVPVAANLPVFKRLLTCMASVALEENDIGLTCLDVFFRRVEGFRGHRHSEFVPHFLEAGVGFSIVEYGLPPVLAHIQLEDYPHLIPDCDEAVEMILRKCELGLERVLNSTKFELPYTGHLYRITTQIGWTRGCEIMFEMQYKMSFDQESMLKHAVRSGSLPTFQFWLRARERVGGVQLARIGSPEEILWLLYTYDFETIWIETVLDALGLWALRRSYLETNPPPPSRTWLAARQHIVQCLSTTTRKRTNRPLITAFIRISIFEALDLRHTCCDIEKITRSNFRNFSPPPWYPAAPPLWKIQKEDAYLVDVLNELVPAFDADYDAFDGDLTAFVTNHLDPKMQEKLEELKRQDEKEYGQGRRELGVVMEVQSDDDNDDEENEEGTKDVESENDDEESSDED